jgi:glycosyltransferase involved in cell wall biosynthesis
LWGVDFDVFRPGSELTWRRQLGFDDDHIVYFSPRSYTQPYYNIDVVIAAAARVKAAEPRARFIFSGYEGDPGPFREKAAAAGIDDVMAMVGRLAHDEFAVALRACDVFISVPSVDATAVSLLEAMASAAGVIISSLPSSLEWISDGQSGLVVEPRDEAGLTAAMLRLGRDAEFRRQCGEAALQTAHEMVGFEQNMLIVDDLFKHLVAGEPVPMGARLSDLKQAGA